MEVKGKRIWITGASSGLGEALAYEFADRGANLILSSRKIKELERVKANCNPAVEVVVQVLDVMEHAKINTITQDLLQKHGAIDILINNAGISQRSLVQETPLAIDKRIMDINYFGAIALTKAVLPAMLAQQSGHIVAMSSLVGKIGSPLRSTYAASKHALHGFYDSLRAEVEQKGIKVTLICPGYIHTNISINAVTSDGSPQNKMDDKQANGLSPEAFARKAVNGIIREKQEFAIGKYEVAVLYIKRFFPRLVHRIVSNVKVT